MLRPVCMVAGGVLILGETLAPQTIAGDLLVIAAVTYIHIEKERSERKRRRRQSRVAGRAPDSRPD